MSFAHVALKGWKFLAFSFAINFQIAYSILQLLGGAVTKHMGHIPICHSHNDLATFLSPLSFLQSTV